MTVFISRTQFPDSDFKTLLEAKGLAVHGQSLIDIRPVLFGEIPAGNWLFFYSKSGVEHFFAQLGDRSIEGKKLGVIGPGTEKALLRQGRQADFVGSGEPEQTASAFRKIAAGETVTFVRAERSKKSVQTLLEDVVKVKDLIVYENSPKTSVTLPYCSILVFTSPLNVQAYFATYILHDEQQVIAIGDSTATALRELGVKEIRIADAPNERGLAEAVLATIQMRNH